MAAKHARTEGGFSYLEIFVALMIVSAGSLCLAMLQLSVVTANLPFSSSNTITATELAQEGIDRLSKAPWDELRSSHPDGFQADGEGVSPAFSRLAARAGDSVTMHGTTFYRVWQVRPDPEIPNLKTITVWCCWQSGRSSWRQSVLVTQRAETGI